MRGALEVGVVQLDDGGIIPADAGSTQTSNSRPTPTRGSSPRMRGAPRHRPATRVAGGIIPADAGSTNLISPKATRQWDHPRGCGEHSRPGSRHPGPPGIIPADAGSTGHLAFHGGHVEDHPRGCGEHLVLLADHPHAVGSSPRMRGAPCSQPWMGSGMGIIPADAGSTLSEKSGISRPKDHPRGCGEHGEYQLMIDRHRGSSPRMRGALEMACCVRLGMGIIPADAGSTGYLYPLFNVL